MIRSGDVTSARVSLSFSPGAGIGSFHFVQGDVILLPEEEVQHGGEARPDEWAVGVCERTGKRGRFPMDCVYVLPCLEKPPDAFLVSADVRQRRG